ncbi:hypothetical protein F5X68DRAFT_144965 [Plectosphaerella plurivora]|uniref:Zn(2)-C6 fungal-type domain-containing protein n=1 Tax=Plectosphaerella plurivora TaxID=936078 RepID=A0A9P8V017_9PEZI|nr:hypothetical protein F5X68DRAFT_144965 [Plectosphaerella plurivora]
MPLSVRRAHTKSRNGCSDCKRRKVKVVIPWPMRLNLWRPPFLLLVQCDETYPSCNHCNRRGIPCSLSASKGPARALSNRLRATAAVADRRDRSTGSTTSPASAPPTSSHDDLEVAGLDIFSRSNQPVPSIAETWGYGLELMHHFSTSTAETLGVRPEIRQLWRVGIPELAYDSPFLMHIILATAASHKAYLLPAQRDRYANLAIYHQTAGIEGFRSALADLDAHDWRAVFCFSSMFVLSLGSAPTQRVPTATPPELDCFVFVRGVRAVLSELEPRTDGTFLGLLGKGVYVEDKDMDNKFEYTLASRHSTLPPGQLQAFEDMSTFFEQHLPPERLIGYQKSVKELRRSAYCIARAGANFEMGLSTVAAYLIPEDVMKDILTLDPFAVVLLAQFCVFFRLHETRFWVLSGLSKRLFNLIEGRVATLPAHLAAISWARTQVFEFWEPPS